MYSESELATQFCSEFLVSADCVDVLLVFSAIAITAWNYADRKEAEVLQAIENLEKKLKVTTVENSGTTLRVNDLVRKMIDRKNEAFSAYYFRIVKADFENEENTIKVNVEVQHPSQAS